MSESKSYIIIPGCSDLNRGDQALVWESIRLFKESGHDGKFLLMSEKNEPVKQSMAHGLGVVTPVLEHPSRKFRNKNNLEYTRWLKIKWGLVSIFDFTRSLLLLSRYSRWIGRVMTSKDAKVSLEAFTQTTAVIVKGGGFIHAYGGLTASYYIYFSLFHVFLAQSLGKKVYIMPNSMGPFEGPIVKWMVKRAFKGSLMVLARESYSSKMVNRQLGIDVGIMPDLAFYLENGKVNKEDFMEKYSLPFDRKLVAMTMRPHRFLRSSAPSKNYMQFKKSMAEMVKWLYANGYMPVLVEHVLAVNYNESDWECIKEVEKYLQKGEYRVLSNREYTCYELKTIYSFFDYIIGTRFHSMIFSMANMVPGIAIAYTGNKGQGIMHDIGLDDYVISIDDVTGDELIKKFKQLIIENQIVKQKIVSYKNNLKKYRDEVLILMQSFEK